jgi:hypothetical protein
VETKVGPIPAIETIDFMLAVVHYWLVATCVATRQLPAFQAKGLNMSELDLCVPFEPHTIRVLVSYTNF